jgi:hypothetical protein
VAPAQVDSARAQATPPATQPSATSRASAAARAAQRSFERTRRDALRFYNGGALPTGLETIGRIVYYDNNGDVPPPEERSDIIREREALIELLDNAAAADPADEWVRPARALPERGAPLRRGRARRPRLPRRRVVVQRAPRPRAPQQNAHAGAEAAFDAALARDARRGPLPLDRHLALARPEGRPGVQGALVRRPRRVRGQAVLAGRPLYILPGNDLRNELLARRTINRIHSQGDIAFQMTWGPDLEESQVRYGWPTAWSVTTGGAGDPRPPSVIGHEPTPSYDFTPRASAWTAPLTVGTDGWSLRAAQARMRYAPRYASEGFVQLEHQIARFRRGDSTLYVGAYNVARDRDWGSGSCARARARRRARAGRPARGARQHAQARRDRARGPTRRRLMSLEVAGNATQKRAARARYAVQPLAADARISDVLLLTRGESGRAPTLEGLLPTCRARSTVLGGSTVGLYWESYQRATPTRRSP